MRLIYRDWLYMKEHACRDSVHTRHMSVHPSAMAADGGAAPSEVEPEVAPEEASASMGAGNHISRRASVREAAFKQHESLLNDLLECDFPVNDATLELPEETRAELTFQMLTHMLEHALSYIKEHRLLLLIEDVQWMDSASCTLLQRVAELVPTLAIVLTTAAEPKDASTDGQETLMTRFPKDLTTLLSAPHVIHEQLGPLTRAEVHELLCDQLRVSSVQDEVVDSVFRRTVGNALYCIELAETMIQRKILTVHSDKCLLAVGVDDLDAIGLPNSLQAAMSSQLDRMPSNCLNVLKAASVMGMYFPAIVLAALSLEGVSTKRERDKLLWKLVELRMLEFVNDSSHWSEFLSESNQSDVYRFSSSMMRDVAYHSLPFEQRRHTHMAMATWIERTMNSILGDKKPDAHTRLWLYPALANHFMQTADGRASALVYLEAAAKSALESNMNHEAMGFLSKKLKLLEHKDAGDEAVGDIARTKCLLAEALLADGKLAQARDAVTDALGLVDSSEQPKTKAGLHKCLRKEATWLRRPRCMKQLFYDHVRLDSEAAMTIVKLYEHLGRTAYLLDEPEMHDWAVLRCLNLALLVRSRGGGRTPEQAKLMTSQLAKAYAAACLVTTLGGRGRVAQCKRFSSNALALAQSLDHPLELALYTYMMAGIFHMRTPDFRLAEQALRSANLFSGTNKLAGRRVEEVSHMLGLVLYLTGQLEPAYRVYTKAREQCLARHDPHMLIQLTAGECLGLLLTGKHGEASDVLGDFLDHLPEAVQESPAAISVHGLLAVCHLHNGLVAEARESAEVALSLMENPKHARLSSMWGLVSAIDVLLRLFQPPKEKQPRRGRMSVAFVADMFVTAKSTAAQNVDKRADANKLASKLAKEEAEKAPAAAQAKAPAAAGGQAGHAAGHATIQSSTGSSRALFKAGSSLMPLLNPSASKAKSIGRGLGASPPPPAAKKPEQEAGPSDAGPSGAGPSGASPVGKREWGVARDKMLERAEEEDANLGVAAPHSSRCPPATPPSCRAAHPPPPAPRHPRAADAEENFQGALPPAPALTHPHPTPTRLGAGRHWAQHARHLQPERQGGGADARAAEPHHAAPLAQPAGPVRDGAPGGAAAHAPPRGGAAGAARPPGRRHRDDARGAGEGARAGHAVRRGPRAARAGQHAAGPRHDPGRARHLPAHRRLYGRGRGGGAARHRRRRAPSRLGGDGRAGQDALRDQGGLAGQSRWPRVGAQAVRDGPLLDAQAVNGPACRRARSRGGRDDDDEAASAVAHPRGSEVRLARGGALADSNRRFPSKRRGL